MSRRTRNRYLLSDGTTDPASSNTSNVADEAPLHTWERFAVAANVTESVSLACLNPSAQSRVGEKERGHRLYRTAGCRDFKLD